MCKPKCEENNRGEYSKGVFMGFNADERKDSMKRDYLTELYLFTDGACRGNPGEGSVAFIIMSKNRREIRCGCARIGQTTNNRAEYLALIEGLGSAAKLTGDTVHCFLDSELVVLQVTEKHQIRDDELRRLFERVLLKEWLGDDKIPSVRELAVQLEVNPNTVARAYSQLEQAGLVVSKTGSGTFVADQKHSGDAMDINMLVERMDTLITRGLNLGLEIDKLSTMFQERLVKFVKKSENGRKDNG